MTSEHIARAAVVLAARVREEAGSDGAEKTRMIVSGVAALAVADEHGAVVFEGDPTAVARLVAARNAAIGMLRAHATARARLGIGDGRMTAEEAVEYLVSRIAAIREASVAGGMSS